MPVCTSFTNKFLIWVYRYRIDSFDVYRTFDSSMTGYRWVFNLYVCSVLWAQIESYPETASKPRKHRITKWNESLVIKDNCQQQHRMYVGDRLALYVWFICLSRLRFWCDSHTFIQVSINVIASFNIFSAQLSPD